MRNVRFYALITGALSMASAAVLVVACGDDTAGPPQADAGPDVDHHDAGVDATSPPQDAGTDAPGPAIAITDYPGLVANGLCSSLARCCFGDPNLADNAAVDGGRHYDATKCQDLYKTLGFEYSNIGANVFDAGTVALDSTKAQDCIDQVKNLPCNMTGQQLEDIRTTCFEAVAGKQSAGQPCRGSIECAKDLFCDVDGGAGGGTPTGNVVGSCAPLRGQGGHCGVYNTGNLATDTETSEESCSWRGGGDTNLRCASYPSDGGDTFPDRSTWTCQPTVGVGEICNSTVSCEKGICDIQGGYVCKSPIDYFASVCTNFTKP